MHDGFPKQVSLDKEAIQALRTILGIMTDQVYTTEIMNSWNFEHIIILDQRFEDHDPETPITLNIYDAALLIDGMAFTEVASAELPWIDMVRWTTDFVTAELRQHWTDEEWQSL
jgi:hypothetical protein